MSVTPSTFVGFGFGPIQAGLFLYEAFRAGNFGRLVVAEVSPGLVDAVRRSGGVYTLNIAGASGVRTARIAGVEVLNPTVPADAAELARALADASEVCTALPSVAFFTKGSPSTAEFLRSALQAKLADPSLPACLVYAAENHNHAAEILQESCEAGLTPAERSRARERIQFLNTVIGKMSGITTDPAQMAAEGLAPLVEGVARAFLVEEFNRILISRISLPGFHRGIPVFVEKEDLLPFEEAKLYGHNAVHALLGYLAARRGYEFMSQIADDATLMGIGRRAFTRESGPALCLRRAGCDDLFTPAGYQAYAEDLLARMTNPFLRDRIDRVIRDTPRKLGWEDRLVGTMRLALDAGIEPRRFALGVAAALETAPPERDTAAQLASFWHAADEPAGRRTQLVEMVLAARDSLKKEDYGEL